MRELKKVKSITNVVYSVIYRKGPLILVLDLHEERWFNSPCSIIYRVADSTRLAGRSYAPLCLLWLNLHPHFLYTHFVPDALFSHLEDRKHFCK